jgi:recombination protein RecA
MAIIMKDGKQVGQSVMFDPTGKEIKEKEAPAKPLTPEEKIKLAKSVTTQLNNEYKDGGILVQKMGKKTTSRWPSLSTDLPTFDELVLGCGGMPDGRIIEIYGPESAGKTAFSLHIIGCAQRAGGLALFVDAEHALDINHARTLGVDVDNLIVSQPDYGEQALEVVLAFVRSRAVRIIVVDSVSALVPKAELDGDMGDSHMGLQARLMSQAMRKLAGEVAKSGTIVIFINQIREKIGVMFGNPETTTGGRALKFYSSVRLEVRRLANTDGGQLKEGDIHVGHRMRIKNVKNKVGPPFRETICDLRYATGFDTKKDMVDYAIETGVVVEGTKTKEKEGNGVPKGWYGGTFEDGTLRNYRFEGLTNDPVFGILKIEAMKARDARLAQQTLQEG